MKHLALTLALAAASPWTALADQPPLIDRNLFYGEVAIAGAQISPVVEVDHRLVGGGKVGEFTQEIQNIYFGAVRGESPKHQDWTIPIY